MSEFSLNLPKNQNMKYALQKAMDSRGFKKAVHKATSTGRLDLEEKRKRLEQKAKLIEGLTSKLLNEKNPPSPKDAERFMNMAHLVMMTGYLEGLGLQVDCMASRERCKIQMKDGDIKAGYRRRSVPDLLTITDDKGRTVSAAELLDEVSEGIGFIAHMMDQYMIPMLKDIGVATRAFRNDHGFEDPEKYDKLDKEEEAATGEKPVEELAVVPEGEAVVENNGSEASQEPMTIEEIKEALNVKE
jgi:hypothetical protein